MAICFLQEEVEFALPKKLKTKKWLNLIAKQEGFQILNLNFVFCSDEFLYRINSEYLGHNTYTDIITFDNSEKDKTLEADIFISIERIKENAMMQKEKFLTEVRRVMSHGLFHLCGYRDKSARDIKTMRSKEIMALEIFNTM